MLLERSDHQVQLAEALRPQAMLLNIGLPDINGDELRPCLE
jgi:DNA-binding response OmpR family regulator